MRDGEPPSLETIILLLAAVLALTTFAQKILIPYPILLVIGGLILGLLPGIPAVTLSPNLVFLVFLPPILWAAAYFTSLRDSARISGRSFDAGGWARPGDDGGRGGGGARSAARHGVGGGDRVRRRDLPPDAVVGYGYRQAAAHSAPHRHNTLEGESLVNDATALVLYRVAVGAVVSGMFTVGGAILEFVYAAVVGVAIGIGVAMLTRWALCATDDGLIHIGITLMAPYIAWVLGESVHASAVLACVAGGLYLRRYFSGAVAPATRIQARAVWDLLIFILNGVIFILIGLQLGPLRAAVPSRKFGPVLLAGAVISLTAIVVRLLLGPAGGCTATVVERGFADARSPASVAPYLSRLMDRYARDCDTRRGVGLAGYNGFRCAIPVSGRNHFDQLRGDTDHSGAPRSVAASVDSRLACRRRPWV